jgi:hypothetical protein
MHDSNALELMSFNIVNGQLSFGKPEQLTPSTNQSITDVALSPDGKVVWYFASQPNGTAEDLYEVSTARPTLQPTAYDPTLVGTDGSTDIDSLEGGDTDATPTEMGWYSNGQFDGYLSY